MLKRDKILLLACVASMVCALGYMWRQNTASAPAPAMATPIPFAPNQVYDETRPFLGDANSRYTLVEFGDYECPPCARVHPEVASWLARNKGKVRFQFRNTPLTRIHKQALPAALVAETAKDDERFWQAHNALYELKGKITPAALAKIAAKTGGSGAKPPSSTSLAAARARIARDEEAAERLDVRGTPSFVLCDQKEMRVLSLDNFGAALAIVP